MGQLGDLYRDGRNRFIDVVRDADPAAPVPTCPAWSVKDVLSHVAGIPADILAGRLDGVATDPWTEAQVAARREKTIADISAEWQETGPQIDAMIDSFGPTGAQLLFDLTTHEQDVRTAVGAGRVPAGEVFDVALGFMVENLRQQVPAPLRIDADHLSWELGEGDPATTLRTTRFELMRATTGRRSARQIAAMDWSGDPEPFLPMFGSMIFSISPIDIVE